MEIRTSFEKFKIHINFLNLCEIDNFGTLFFQNDVSDLQGWQINRFIQRQFNEKTLISKINAMERFRDQPSSNEQMPDLFLFHQSTQN